MRSPVSLAPCGVWYLINTFGSPSTAPIRGGTQGAPCSRLERLIALDTNVILPSNVMLARILSNKRACGICLYCRKCVDPGQNGRRVENDMKNLCFHSQIGSTSVPLDSCAATADGLAARIARMFLDLHPLSSDRFPTLDHPVFLCRDEFRLSAPIFANSCLESLGLGPPRRMFLLCNEW